MEINTSISKISSALMETSYQTTPVQVLSTETDQKTETATIQITIRAILKKIEKNKDDATKDTELRLSNTAIYCTLGGTVIFIIGLVLSLSYISWKKILAKSIRLHDLSSSIAQVPQIPIEMPNRQSEISEENDYEDIDEDNVIQEPMVSDHETISTSSSTDKSVYGGTDSGGYLHPYHSLVSENNARKSNGAETESIAEDIDLSEYKPYQQVCESMQEQYECTHIKHRNNQNIGMPVQDIHVMTNEYHKYM